MRRRSLAAVIALALFWIASCAIGYAPAFAQIGGPPGAPAAPLPPPPPPPGAQPQVAPAGGAPAAPGAPGAVATTGALPQLAPAPRVIQAPLAVQSPQVFRCSCFGTGLGTQWVGVVQSSSYTLADQSAQQQCISFNLNANPPSPYIAPPSFGFSTNPYPVVNPNGAPGNVVNPYRGMTTAPGQVSSATIQRLALAGLCSRCACN